MRLFIAVEIDNAIKEKILKAQNELPKENIRLVEEKNLHITLKFLGEVEEKKVEIIKKLLSNIEFKKFNIKIVGAGAFPNKNYARVIWIGCKSEDLNKLATEINEKLSVLFSKEDFKAHLTIARAKGKVSLKEFFEKYENIDFGEMEVNKFILFRSTLNKNGPIYEKIAEFGLR